MTDSNKKQYSFLQLTDAMIKEFGGSTEKKETRVKTASDDMRDPKKKLEWIALPPDILDRLEDYVGDPPPKNWKQSVKPNTVVNSLNYRSSTSTITKRKSYGKKNIKTTNINAFLYKTNDQEKSRVSKIPAKNLGSIEKFCKSNTARKELFKVPPSKFLISRKSVRNAEGGTTNRVLADQSPLIDIEKAELLFKKKSYIKDNVFKSAVPLAKDFPNMISTAVVTDVDTSPSMSGSTVNIDKNVRKLSENSEFEVLEELCETELESVKKNISCIRSCVNEVRMEFEKKMGFILENLDELENRLSKMERKKLYKERQGSSARKKLGHQIEKDSDLARSKPEVLLSLNEENIKPSNENIKSPKKRNSSGTSSRTNMRMNLLKSNLLKSGEGSQTEKKAQNMYNSLRNTFGLLETPKFDRRHENANFKDRNLSRKVQNQCLMLLDTPKQD